MACALHSRTDTAGLVVDWRNGPLASATGPVSAEEIEPDDNTCLRSEGAHRTLVPRHRDAL
ncbi:hypothetical protein CHELA40_11519 [Chelatococcus asaccharovorans]|nr:hypothetical protein CHELA40_11519 [Chelatococcus asaccharovorans]CAH1684607.1 hypothetical protein CHELA17_64085 [Chelatococcus asaccharovorans]